MVIPLTSHQFLMMLIGAAVVFCIALLVIAVSNDFQGGTRALARAGLRLCLFAYLAYGLFVLWFVWEILAGKPRGDGYGFLAGFFLIGYAIRHIIAAIVLLVIVEWILREYSATTPGLELDEDSGAAWLGPRPLFSQLALDAVWIFGLLLVAVGAGYGWLAYDDYRLTAVERRLAKLDHGNVPFDRASYDADLPFFTTATKDARMLIWSTDTRFPADLGTVRSNAAYYLSFWDERRRSAHYAAGEGRHAYFSRDRKGTGYSDYLDLYDFGRNRVVAPIPMGENEHILDVAALPGPQEEILILTDQSLQHWSIPRHFLIRSFAHDLKRHLTDKFRHELYHELAVSRDGTRAAFVAADINLMIVPLSRPQDDVIELSPEQLGKAGGAPSRAVKRWQREFPGLMFSRDGTQLYVGRPDGLLAVDTSTGAVVARTTSSDPCVPRSDDLSMRPLAVTWDGASLVVQTHVAVACVIDLRTFAPIREINRGGYRPIPDPDRIRLKDGRIGFTSTDSGRGDVLAVSADGARVAISSPQIDRTLVFATATGALVTEVCPFRCRMHAADEQEHPRNIALSRDGAILLVSGDAGHAAWDAMTGAFLFALDDMNRPKVPRAAAAK